MSLIGQMSVSPVLSATSVLEAGNVPSPLVLHLSGASAASESEYEPAVKPTASTSRPVIVNGRLLLNPKRIYKCTFDGCDKSYAKPSRLEEHERSHNGNRPFVCTTCDKSYLRETHLQAHVRSHLSNSDRPFACEESDCDKRFWTAQHLRAHKEVIHFGEKPFKCDHAGCTAAFLKHHRLRAHLASEHASPGTKPYQCDHEECTKSFSTNQKLRAHLKVHEENRYTCVNATCRAGPESAFYPTWTALQHHMRMVHPPTCPHEECAGRTFSAQKGLRAHLRLHEQRAIEEHEHASSEDEALPRKRRRGGEVGRDWKCEVEGCTKDFKSKKALTTHHAITHLGKRDFVCTVDGCGRAFGYKHILQRHQARGHNNDKDEDGEDAEQHADADGESSDGGETRTRPKKRKTRHATSHSTSIIDEITGVAYAKRSAGGQAPLKCPHPTMEGLPSALPASRQSLWSEDAAPCEYVFRRAYDLRRHLQAVHGISLDKEVVDAWARKERA
ncbi:hypothetical protein EDB83DRAFT_2638027 [Lactarius deliciosus]|nr:hypothetical protein EDB83DRAFT_2638027 [Lactarius deliciosus]